MKIKISLGAILLFLCSLQIVFAQEKVLSGGIINGRATKLPTPDYPQAAEDFCVSGQVQVRVLVDENGNVISAEAISGDELLRSSAIEAAKKAKFKSTPEIHIKTKGIVVYNFVPKVKCIQVGIVNQRAKYLAKPIYPKGCRCEGVVKVRIVVDTDGNVISAEADSGNPQLRASAVEAARKTKFSPSRIDGPPIFVVAFLEYKFYSNGRVST